MLCYTLGEGALIRRFDLSSILFILFYFYSDHPD